LEKILERYWKLLEKILEKYWKLLSKILEKYWKLVWKILENTGISYMKCCGNPAAPSSSKSSFNVWYGQYPRKSQIREFQNLF